MKNVLLVAGLSERYYYGPFLAACDGKVNIYIFDPSAVPDNGSISLYLGTNGSITGFVDVLKIKGERIESIRLTVSDIHIAWYLRENGNQSDTKKSSLETRFLQNESRGAIQSILSVLDCIWVNRKETVDFLASNKLYQQKIAQQSGLLVPPTLISNNPEDVNRFSCGRDGLLLKTIGYIRLDEEGKHFIYSQRFPHEELTKSSVAISMCPIFAQEYIEKKYEYRVMVIGNKVLACKIDSQASEATKIDWRHYDLENVEHSQTELPEEIQRKLVAFMEKIGLRYGAIDLIETPDGNFVFLEVNPSGQWGWVADIAGLPIPEAVAEMLESL